MAGCLFCGIANHDIDSEIVHETDGTIAFRDINPAGPTHVLVIPKKHIASAQELSGADADLLGELFDSITAVASAAGVADGYRVVTNVGAEAGQSVHHLHFHVIGGRSMAWPPG